MLFHSLCILAAFATEGLRNRLLRESSGISDDLICDTPSASDTETSSVQDSPRISLIRNLYAQTMILKHLHFFQSHHKIPSIEFVLFALFLSCLKEIN